MEQDKELEAFFAAARAEVPVPDDAFLARIAAEGAALQPAPRPAAPAVVEAPRGGFGVGLRGLLGAIGGWPVLGGMVTAGLAGLWFGFADVGGISNYVYGGTSEGWLFGPADIVALTVEGDGV